MMAGTQGTDRAMTDPAQLYEADFYRWTQEQAALLRQVPRERINLPVDWLHAAEEIEDMGRRDLRTVNSLIGVVFEHLLKLEYSPAAQPRDGWKETVNRSRGEILRTLDDSPSLRTKLSGRWHKEYGLARKNALSGLARDGVDPQTIPTTPPYSVEQVIDHAWWPANYHGHAT